MKIKTIRLPMTECFACTLGPVKRAFGEFEDLNIYFGALSRTFRFDSRLRNRPTIKGNVVVSLGLNKDCHGIMEFYPVKKELITTKERTDFEENVLSQLRDWYDGKLKRTETEVFGLGYETIYVELRHGNFMLHTTRQ